MKTKYIYIVLLILCYSCANSTPTNEQKDPTKQTETNYEPPTVTTINQLHDTLQPKVTYLKNTQKPKTTTIPPLGGKGIVHQLSLSISLTDTTKTIIHPEAQGQSSFTTYTSNDGLAMDAISWGQGSIFIDNKGNIWFATQGGGVSKYDGESFSNYTTAQGLANNSVLSIAEDKTGNLWFGTDGGVSKYDGKSFSNYTTAQGLANNSVRCIAEDKTGNLWFGTYGGGVSKYDGESFSSYTTVQGLANNSVRSIAEDKTGNLWFGTDGGGVSKYDGESFSSYTTAQGLANNFVMSIAEDKTGNIWFGTDGGGVSKYDGESFSSYTTAQGLANNSVLSIEEDKTGNLWFGTYGGGVSKYDGESFSTYTTAQGLANNSVFSITEDKIGNLWFGTYGGGVSKYDGESFSTYTAAQGLANNTVMSIAEDKTGNLWFGTYGGGVSVISNKLLEKNDNIQFLTLNNVNGLPGNGVAAIRFNQKGELIVGTNFGLWTLSTKEVQQIQQAVENGKPGATLGKLGAIYNQFNGYPIKDVNTASNNGAMHIARDGKVWVGHGNNGVTRVNLDAVHKSDAVPNVIIHKVNLVGENVCYYSFNESWHSNIKNDTFNKDSITLVQQEIATYGKNLTQAERSTLQYRFSDVTFDGIASWYPLPQNLVLPYKYNALTFEFKAIETNRSYLVNYQYKLEGSDKNWHPITKKKEATYTNLAEGKYTFLLKAQSPWGVWSEPVKFEFTVLPPWYRTWWMYALYALAVTLLVRLLIRMQTKKLKQRQIELETEVAVATQEVRSQKLEVEKTLEVVEQQKEQVEEAHKEITDSINYAERIQRSFLATEELLNENLKEYFVLFQPKGVVSGDFYWVKKLSNGNFTMVNADSTGHGVPGAIMSILNISSIENAVKEGFTNPADIFNSTRKTIIERLKKDGSEHGGKDGMDASIICYDFKNLKIQYCAAQNPIWIVRNGEVIQIKPEKMPVGKHDNDHIQFIGGEFNLQKGDQVYTLTDGFQDQFGGPKGKKFMVKRMRQFVLDNSHLSMVEQHQKLDKALINWKGDVEQVDDVCIIGVKIT